MKLSVPMKSNVLALDDRFTLVKRHDDDVASYLIGNRVWIGDDSEPGQLFCMGNSTIPVGSTSESVADRLYGKR